MRGFLYVCAALACGPVFFEAAGQTQRTHGTASKIAALSGPVPTGPTAVVDTSKGRLTCRLFAKEKPRTVALFTGLAVGTIPWLDAATNGPVQGKPLYDATLMYGIAAGAAGGRRINVAPGLGTQSLQPEPSTTLKFDRPGRLALRITGGDLDGRSFYVLDHAEERTPEVSAGIFGQCDNASVKVVETISHELLATDNHPKTPVVIHRVAIVSAGDTLPPPAPAVPLSAVPDAASTAAPLEALTAPEPTGPDIRIETAVGTIACKLFRKEAPIAVENFIGLATGAKPFIDPKTKLEVRGKHYYDGLAFGRVVPDFMIQNADLPNDPSGGETIGFHFGNEIVPGLTFDRPGRMAYANSGPETNESEFFITEHPNARLNGSYTIFGQCDAASMPVVEAIARVPRNAEDHAFKPVRIVRITVQPQ